MAWYDLKKNKAESLGSEKSVIGQLSKRRKDIEAQMDGEEVVVVMNDAEEKNISTDDRRGYTKEKW
jgi:hypothetical protein